MTSQQLLAVWPVLDATRPMPDLVAKAERELDAIAGRTRVDLTAPTTDSPRVWQIRPGREVPGSGGAPWVLTCQTPARPAPRRSYWKATA